MKQVKQSNCVEARTGFATKCKAALARRCSCVLCLGLKIVLCIWEGDSVRLYSIYCDLTYVPVRTKRAFI